MAATELRKPSVSRKSIAAQLLFVVVLLLIGRFLWMRNQPERLTQAPYQQYKISGDNLYMFAGQAMVVTKDMFPSQGSAEQGGITLQAQSLLDGEKRVVSKDDLRYQSYLLNEFSIAEGKLYYAVEPRRKSTTFGGGSSGGGVSVPARFLGVFLPPLKSSADMGYQGRKRIRLGAAPLPTLEVRFRQVSMQGGTPQDVATIRLTGPSSAHLYSQGTPPEMATIRPAGVCLVGNHVFWIRAEPEESVQVTQEQGNQRRTSWTEVTAHSDLMLTSLSDGVTRRIYHGVSRDTVLYAGDSGVAWSEPAPFPGRPTLCYARVSDGSVRSVGTLLGEGQGSVGQLVEVGNRLYWTYPAQFESPACVVMSANLDGTDLREICAQREKHPLESLLLHAYQGSLYCCLTEAPMVTGDDTTRTPYLCRLRPERADPLEIVCKLPKRSGRYQFDGGYLYFVLSEQKRSLWASLTDDPAAGQEMDTLCRVPLDH